MATIAPDRGPREVASTAVDVMVSVGDRGDHLCVTITGELDLVGAQVLRIVAEPRLAGPPRRLVIDGERVSFCDAAGLRALLALQDVAEENGSEVRLRRPSAPLRWLLELTGTAARFTTSAR